MNRDKKKKETRYEDINRDTKEIIMIPIYKSR